MYRIVLTLIGSSLIMAAPVLSPERGMSSSDAHTTVQTWPKEAKKAAEMMIQKYGEPDEITAMRLVWHDNGPWKRTIVTKEDRSRLPNAAQGRTGASDRLSRLDR